MKTILRTLALLFVMAVAFTGCKKYEEGPKLSLRTKKARLCHEWKVTNINVNGVDVTPITAFDIKLDIEKNGSYKLSISGLTDEGKWELGEDKDDIYMTSNVAGSVEQAYRILKLENKEIWFRSTAPNGDKTITKYGRAD